MADFASNWDDEWPCVSDVTAIVETGFLVYTYINEYIENQDFNKVLAAISYGTLGVEKLSNWACSGEATVFWGDLEDYAEPDVRDVPFADMIIKDEQGEFEDTTEAQIAPDQVIEFWLGQDPSLTDDQAIDMTESSIEGIIDLLSEVKFVAEFMTVTEAASTIKDQYERS